MELSKAARRELLLQWQDRVYDYIFRQLRNEADAADITQETLLTIYNEADSIRDPDKLSVWIYRVALNKIFNLRRSREREVKRLETIGPGADAESTVDLVTRSQTQAHVRDAIDRLPWRDQEVLVLRYFHELTQRQIAEVLEISRTSVRRRLETALENLKKHVQPEFANYSVSVLEASLIGSSLISNPAQAGCFTTHAAAQTALAGVITMKKAIALGIITLAVVGGTIVTVESRRPNQTQVEIEQQQAKFDDLQRRYNALQESHSKLNNAHENQQREINSLKQLNKSLSAKVAQLNSSAKSSPVIAPSANKSKTQAAKQPKKRRFRFGLGEQDSKFDAIDWPEFSETLTQLKPTYKFLLASLDPTKEVDMKSLQTWNKLYQKLNAVGVPVYEELGEVGPQSAISHPAFIANVVRVLLDQAGAPLSEDQLEKVDALGKAWVAKMDQESPSSYQLKLEYLYQRVEIKRQFVNALERILSDVQFSLIVDPKYHSRPALDPFSPTSTYPFRLMVYSETVAALSTKAIERILSHNQQDQQRDLSRLSWVSDQWVDSSPFVSKQYSQQDMEVQFPTPDNLQNAARAQIDAMNSLLTSPDVSKSEKEALKKMTTIYIPVWVKES